MKFCPNCGKELPDGVKFCPYCGYKLTKESDEITKEKSKNMTKGVTKSLQELKNLKKATQEAKPIHKSGSESFDKEKPLRDGSDVESVENSGKYLLPNKTIALYFILNLILQAGSSSSDEVMGIFIYTWIVLIIIFLRRNKEKPFNWLLNIIIFLQGILVFSVGMMTLDYIGAAGAGDSLGAIIGLGVLALLFITILLLLYQGNRSKQ